MKRSSRQSIRDSKETAKQSETAAQFLEDLAGHADTAKERQRCLAVAKDLRSAAHSTARKSKPKKS
jgi:alkyl sulfatase BDS1-like metallo-beta-lactamase superfamily hydrolase